MSGAPSESVRAGQRKGITEDPVHVGPTLLDYLDQIGDEVSAGQRRRDDGMRTALHGEDVRLVSAIEAEVRRLAETGVEFSADDVLPDLAARRAIGSVFSRFAREGLIVCVGATSSKRPERHHGLTRVWRGGGS